MTRKNCVQFEKNSKTTAITKIVVTEYNKRKSQKITKIMNIANKKSYEKYHEI